VKKVLLAMVLFAAAGFIAFCVKDVVDYSNPEYAIPQVSVKADITEIPIVMGSYYWRFAFGSEIRKSEHELLSVEFMSTNLLGGEHLNITFSVEPKNVYVRRSAAYSYVFSTVETDSFIPYERGGYIYDVTATFDSGTMEFYFYVVV